MGSAFHQLCPRHSGTLTPTAPTAIKLWDTFTFTFFIQVKSGAPYKEAKILKSIFYVVKMAVCPSNFMIFKIAHKDETHNP